MKKLYWIGILWLFLGCEPKKSLPILNTFEIRGGDTVYEKGVNFQLTDQDSSKIDSKTLLGKITVVDFIFLDCPTICPIMHQNMLKVYRLFEKQEDVVFLSHTIEPEKDTIPRLKAFSKQLGVASNKWHFLTGHQDSILKICSMNYSLTAYKDSTAPGGLAHSGALLLLDKNGLTRGVYDGTDSLETQRLIDDLRWLVGTND